MADCLSKPWQWGLVFLCLNNGRQSLYAMTMGDILFMPWQWRGSLFMPDQWGIVFLCLNNWGWTLNALTIGIVSLGHKNVLSFCPNNGWGGIDIRFCTEHTSYPYTQNKDLCYSMVITVSFRFSSWLLPCYIHQVITGSLCIFLYFLS